jgi:hypothetical protein
MYYDQGQIAMKLLSFDGSVATARSLINAALSCIVAVIFPVAQHPCKLKGLEVCVARAFSGLKI